MSEEQQHFAEKQLYAQNYFIAVASSTHCASWQSKELTLEVRGLTENCPPADPYSPVVDMFLAVGDFQEYMNKRQLSKSQGATGELHALGLFSDFIENWMADSQVPSELETANSGVHSFTLLNQGVILLKDGNPPIMWNFSKGLCVYNEETKVLWHKL